MPPWPYALEDAHGFIREHRHQDLGRTAFAITLEDALIGGIDVRMNPADHSQRGPGPKLGYRLAQPYWGCGYMTEAARGLLAHVFDAGLGDVVYSGAFADNAACCACRRSSVSCTTARAFYARPRDGRSRTSTRC